MMRARPGLLTIAVLLLFLCSNTALADNSYQLTPIEADAPDLVFSSGDASRDACQLVKHNGTAGSFWSEYTNGDRSITYFDPTSCAVTDPYPYEVQSLSFSLYDNGGYQWPVTVDVVVYDVIGTGDPCNGPGTELCRITVTCDSVTFAYPNVGTVSLSSPCCTNQPFFIGLQYNDAGTGPFPSILFDSNALTDTCDNWIHAVNNAWHEWYTFWAPPIAGYPIFWVDGETGSGACDIPRGVVLFQTGAMEQGNVEDRGWPVFGATASVAEFGQTWTSSAAVPFRVNDDWLLQSLAVTGFGTEHVTGDPTPQMGLVIIREDDGTGLPGASIFVSDPQPFGLNRDIEIQVEILSMTLTSGDYWIEVAPADPTSRIGWGQTSSSGVMAKSLDGGLTWEDQGSPFSDVAQPGVTIRGVYTGADLLFETGSQASGDVEERGWPVFGEQSSLTQFGQPWTTVPALPFLVLDDLWSVSSIAINAFGPHAVTGVLTPQHASLVVYHDDGGGAPLHTVWTSAPILLGTPDEYLVTIPGGLTLPRGDYWIGMLPATDTTLVGWTMASMLWDLAKSLDGGLTWGDQGSPFSFVQQPTVVINGSTGGGEILFHTGSIAQGNVMDRGWHVFGQQSSIDEFGQSWTSSPAVPFKVSGQWTVNSLSISAIGPLLVAGIDSPQDGVHLVIYDDNGGLPGAEVWSGLIEASVNPTIPLDFYVNTGGLILNAGDYWVSVRPGDNNTKIAWLQTTSTGDVAKTLDDGLTWSDQGSPFVEQAQPAVTIFGDFDATEVLYSTGSYTDGSAEDRGWPVFGLESSLAEFGQPWDAAPAVPFTVPNQWTLEDITVSAFGPQRVTGLTDDKQQVELVIRNNDVGNIPGAEVWRSDPLVIGMQADYHLTLPVPQTLFMGDYWLSMEPQNDTTKVAWAMTSTTGDVAKTVDGGSTWSEQGSPFSGVQQPGLSLSGSSQSGEILFQTGSLAQGNVEDRGWPVMGLQSSLDLLGQSWVTAPAVPFTVKHGWTVFDVSVSAFGPVEVTGDPASQQAFLNIYDDNGGLPGTIVWSGSMMDITRHQDYRESIFSGLPLGPGDYWVTLIPADPNSLIGWSQSSTQGEVAKTLDEGLTWNTNGSPFSSVPQPAVTISGMPYDAYDRIFSFVSSDLLNRGWPVFGSDASLDIFGQAWTTIPAVKFEVVGQFEAEDIAFAALGPHAVTGSRDPQHVTIEIRDDNGGLPGTTIWGSDPILVGTPSIYHYSIPSTLLLPQGTYWISILPTDPSSMIGWMMTIILDEIAKSINAGATWNEMGSPFTLVPRPAISLGGFASPGNVLFETGSIAAGNVDDRGWTVFGQQTSQTVFGQPYLSAPAVPFEVTGEWIIEDIAFAAFGPQFVDGTVAPQTVIVAVYDDNGGLPGIPIWTGAPVSGIEMLQEYHSSTGTGLVLSAGNYWVSVLPVADPLNTQLGWAQTTTTGTFAKTLDGGETWNIAGPAKTSHQQPAVMLLGTSTSGCCDNPGDFNNDGNNDVSDLSGPFSLVSFMFLGGPPPPCPAEGDFNGDGNQDVSDLSGPTSMVAFMFLGGPLPVCGPEKVIVGSKPKTGKL